MEFLILRYAEASESLLIALFYAEYGNSSFYLVANIYISITLDQGKYQ
jgi:hypothetical protein